MGREKARLEETEEAWNRKAKAESIKCSVCSQHIIHGEREIYFETNMCGYCAHQAQKND